MAVAVGDQRRNKEAQEFLVQELAKGEEDGIPNLLRTAIERGWFSSIPGFLVEAKKKKETEIDRICSRHYTDFLGSVNELLKMKGSVQELKALVFEINGKFNSTGGELVESLNDLSNIQTERDHAKRLLESAIACKELAGQLTEVRQSLEREQHYQAMRLIQGIQGEQTNPLIRPMARHLQTWLPIAKNKLLYAARTEADTFVQSLRDKMGIIGNTLLIRQARASLQYYHTSVMNATLAEGGFEGNYMRRELTLNQSARDYASSSSMSGRASIALGYILLNAASFRLNMHIGKGFQPEQFIPIHFTLPHNREGSDLVDYKLGEIAPLHKALHIYHELGIVNNFHDHYRHDRREIFTKMLKLFERNANSMGLLRAAPKYFEELTGFFAIESIMGNMIENNNDIFSKAELEALWIEAMTKVRDVSLLMGITLSSPMELLQLKEEMLLLLHVMADEIIGMEMDALLTVMWTLFDSFDALSVQHVTVQIRDALDQSSFQRFVVTSPEVYQMQIRHFRLDMIDVNQDSPKYQVNFGNKSRISAANAATSTSSGNNTNSGLATSATNTQSTGSEGLLGRSMMDVDAHLDALEQEMGLSTVNPAMLASVITASNSSNLSSNNNGNSNTGVGSSNTRASFITNSLAGGAMSLDDHTSSAKFMPQTYPFSAFVPLILTELQFALTRLFLFVIVPAPESWARQRRQQDKVARLVAAQGGNATSIAAGSTAASSGAALMGDRSTSPAFNASTSNNNTNNATNTASASNTVGNFMLNLATHAGSNIHVTDFLCRNLLGLFALLCDQLQVNLQRDGLETALSKACQIAIDTTFITLSIDFFFSLLEVNLGVLFGTEAYDPTLLQQAQEVVMARLRQISSQAQDLIFELLANKIDALLESLQFIDYAPEYPPAQVYPAAGNNHHHHHHGANGAAPNPVSFMVNLGAANTLWVHDSIESLVDFLTITFMCFTHLPQAVREAVHFTSCAKLAQGIIEFLLSERVPKLNIYALVALDADIKRLMAFADSCGIPDLRRCFDELHDMVKAALHPDLAQIGEDVQFRTQLFPHLSAEKLALLLDKVLPSPVSASASNLPGLDKTLTKMTVKRLRSQQQQQSRESVRMPRPSSVSNSGSRTLSTSGSSSGNTTMSSPPNSRVEPTNNPTRMSTTNAGGKRLSLQKLTANNGTNK